MSPPPELELSRFRRVASDLREIVAERGHRVDVALEADRSFGSSNARSALFRDLVIDAISQSASQHAVDFRPVNGGGREFRTFGERVDRRYRLRRAHEFADGGFRVVHNSDSALAREEPDGLVPTENWVFGYVPSRLGLIAHAFLAQVLGFVEGNPGYLRLGHALPLLGNEPLTGGFMPQDEELDGFELVNDEDASDTGEL